MLWLPLSAMQPASLKETWAPVYLLSIQLVRSTLVNPKHWFNLDTVRIQTPDTQIPTKSENTQPLMFNLFVPTQIHAIVPCYSLMTSHDL